VGICPHFSQFFEEKSQFFGEKSQFFGQKLKKTPKICPLKIENHKNCSAIF